jgi:hypothetical protein
MVTDKYFGKYNYIIIRIVCSVPGLLAYVHGGTRWPSFLRHYTTSRKAAGSIPDGVTEIFQ